MRLLTVLRRLIPAGQTASAGATPANARDDPTAVIGCADAALYTAKRRGRDRSEVLLPE